jgi:hypothetical protein
MTNIRTFAVIICFTGNLAFSQETSHLEIFGGYSFSEQTQAPYSGHAATNGWQAALQFNLTPRIGLIAESSGQYGTPRNAAPEIFGDYVFLPGSLFATYTFLFGPEVNVFRRGRVSINLRGLAGFSRQANPGGTQIIPENSLGPRVFPVDGPVHYGFTGAAGVNVDLRLKGGLSWRVVQPDVLFTHLEATWKPDYRAATGLVFTFGKR